MSRIRSCFPDPIQFWIRGFKRACELYRIDDGFSMNGAKLCNRGATQKANPHIAKSRLRAASDTVCRNRHKICTEVISTALLACNACGERFEIGLSISDRDQRVLRR